MSPHDVSWCLKKAELEAKQKLVAAKKLQKTVMPIAVATFVARRHCMQFMEVVKADLSTFTCRTWKQSCHLSGVKSKRTPQWRNGVLANSRMMKLQTWKRSVLHTAIERVIKIV